VQSPKVLSVKLLSTAGVTTPPPAAPNPAPARDTSTPNGQVIPNLPYQAAVAKFSTRSREDVLGQCNPVGIIIDDQDKRTFVFGTNLTAAFSDPVGRLRDRYLVPALRKFFRDASLGPYNCEVSSYPSSSAVRYTVKIDRRYYGVRMYVWFATTCSAVILHGYCMVVPDAHMCDTSVPACVPLACSSLCF
jgi:hypothetical protein